MKFFSIDGPLFGFLSRLVDMLKLNVLWLLCSLPLVTVGAATTAAFSVTLKMAEDREGYVTKAFFRAFRANLKQGTAAGLLNLFFAYALYLDFQLFHAVEGNPIWFLILGIAGTAMCIGYFLYTYALLARYENSLLGTVKNSMEICIRYFGRTIVLILLLVIELLVFFFNSTTLFLWILIGPATLFLTVSGPAMRIFRDIEKKAAEG